MLQKFEFIKTDFEGAYIINPFVSTDSRGAFIKDYSKEIFEANGINHNLAEVFYAENQAGVIRGMHFQRVFQQVKLVRCVKGKIYDVIVDLRPDSPTFLKWQGFYLTEDNFKQIYVPENFAHGYLALEPSTVVYKCNEGFKSEYDDGIKFDDPDFNITWPINEIKAEGFDSLEKLIRSEKDQNLQSFAEYKRKYL